MAHKGKDLDEFESTRAELYVNEPPWRWSSKRRGVGDYYPPIGDELNHDLSDFGDSSSRDDESLLADYITLDSLAVHQARARRKERAKTLLKRGTAAGASAIKVGKASGKLALERGESALKKSGSALVSGGRALVKGAEMTAKGINRYGKWADEVDARAFQRGERQRQAALKQQQAELNRQRAAMELQREQRQLDLEERRLQLELQRKEMQMRREFGEPAPQRSATPYGGGYTPSSQQQNMFSPFGGPTYGFGVPEPGFENPRDIIMRGSGINLFGTPEPERRPPKKKTKQGPPPAKKKAAAPKKKHSTR